MHKLTYFALLRFGATSSASVLRIRSIRRTAVYQGEAACCCVVLTVQAEGDVDDSLLSEALQIWDLGALEVCGRGRVPDVDPADGLLSIQEVHGCGLFGAGGQQAVDSGATQGGGLDVLGVGDQQDGQTVDWHWKETWAELTVSRRHIPTVIATEKAIEQFKAPDRGVCCSVFRAVTK